MATRWYFGSSGTPSASPTINPGGEWEHANTARRPLRATLGTSTVSGGLYAPDAADHLVDGDSLVFHFISDEQLAAQTISAQALKWQFQMQESNAANNLFMTIKVYLVNSDGSSVGDTILAIQRDGTELPTSFTNRGDSGTSSVANANDGDRIVVEVGFGGTPSASGGVQGHNGNVRIGEDASSGDLPEDNAETGTTFRPWLEFANSLTFKSSGVSGSAAGVATASATTAARRATSASTSGAASATSSVTARRALAAAIAGIATVAVTVGKVAATVVTASVAGSSTVSASIAAHRAVSATVAGVATVSAAVSGPASSLADFVTDWSSIPTEFTQVTGGSGSISVSDNDLVLAKPSSSDYAYLYLTEALPKDQDWIAYLPGLKFSATTMNYQAMLVSEAGGPTIGGVSALLNKICARVSQGVNGTRQLFLDRFDAANARTQWNNAGATWASPTVNSAHTWNADDRTDVFIQNDGANERWRFGVVGGAQPHNDTTNPGQLLVTLTDWTDWSSTFGAGSDVYLVLGMPANDNSSGNVSVGRGFKFSISDPADRTWVLNNTQDAISDGWVVRRSWGCGHHDTGILFVPEDRSTIAIDKGGAGEFDENVAKDKSWAYGKDGNLYCFWDGTTPGGSSDYKIAVGIVTGGTPDGAIDKGTSTPIVPLGGVGEPAPDGTERAFFPYAFWDDTDLEWKLFAGTLTSFSAPTQWGIVFYTNPSQDPRSGTWTYRGLILQASGTGWRQNGLNGPIVFHHNGKWEVWVAGADGSASVVWTQGRFYGTDLNSLTEDVNNPRQDITPPAQQLTSSVTNSNTIPVADTTGYTPGAFVVIDDDSNTSNYVRARIRKIVSSTSIELFNRVTIGANAWIFQSGTGSIQAQSIKRGDDGKWYFYTTPFALERGSSATTVAYCETSGLARLDDIESGQIEMVHDLLPAPSPIMNPNGGQRSLENPALINDLLTHTITVSGVATVTATITKQGGAAAAVSASVAGTSTVSATVAARRAVSASATGVATVAETTAARRAVSATAAGTASVTATASKQGTQSIAASVAGTSTISATVTAKHAVSATAAGTSTVTTTTAAKRAVAASAAGQATVSASVQRQGQSSVIAAAAGTSTVSASILRIRSLTIPAVSGTSTATATAHARRALDVTVTGSASAAAAFAPGARHFQVTSTGLAAVSATISRISGSAALTGKYAAEHAAAFRDVLAVETGGFAPEHRSASDDVSQAGA